MGTTVQSGSDRTTITSPDGTKSAVVSNACLSISCDVEISGGRLEVGEDGVTAGKITLYDSGTVTDHATMYTNSDGDLKLEAVANSAIIENVIDGSTGWFVVSDQAVPSLMTIKHTTGDTYIKGNLGIGVTQPSTLAKFHVSGDALIEDQLDIGGDATLAQPHKVNIVTSAGASLAKSLLLVSDDPGAGAAIGVTFRTTTDFQAYSKGGIYFEATGEGWGVGAMHFCVNESLSTSDVAIGHSKMKITRQGDVEIAQDLKVTGGLALGLVTTAVNMTTAGQSIVGITDTSVARTITISSADITVVGRMITVKDQSGAAGTNNITIATEGAQNIDGASTALISINSGSVTMYSDGSDLFIV